MKVVRHINHGPSAWIVSNVENPVCDVKHPDPVKTLAEPPRDDTASGTTLYKTKESGLAGKQVTEVTMQHVDDETHGQETYGRRKVVTVYIEYVLFLQYAESQRGWPEPESPNSFTIERGVPLFCCLEPYYYWSPKNFYCNRTLFLEGLKPWSPVVLEVWSSGAVNPFQTLSMIELLYCGHTKGYIMGHQDPTF